VISHSILFLLSLQFSENGQPAEGSLPDLLSMMDQW